MTDAGGAGAVDASVRAAAEEIRAGRDLHDMGPTIERYRLLAEAYPESAFTWLEYGGAFDSAGQESEAVRHYERALELGLSGDDLRACLLQYGSTLRNVGRTDDSIAALARGVREFPEFAALRVFLALSLHTAGRSDAAVAELMRTVADVGTAPGDDWSIGRYARAIRGYADEL